ncbi:glutathione synthase [Gammaproteobacteria bacterium]|nr:glutathione synthase [Gammaproteobacteria bacterium]
MKIIVQMDPIETLNLAGDSTFALLLEAQERGYELDIYTPNMLTLRDGLLTTEAQQINVFDKPDRLEKINQTRSVMLDKYDIILMRQDPPFDMGYITATHLLETIQHKTLILNNPFYVRNCPEKIFVNKYLDFMPPTLITRNVAEVIKFRHKHDQIIIKPLYGNGGANVFYSDGTDRNFGSIIENFLEWSKEPFIIQKFIPKVKDGDKRIILIDGEIAGAINRLPQEGEIRSNMHVGGQAIKTEITKQDIKICDAISGDLKNFGLFFVGIDIIDNFITEINVTSPTGIREILELSGINVAKIFWDQAEKKVSK